MQHLHPDTDSDAGRIGDGGRHARRHIHRQHLLIGGAEDVPGVRRRWIRKDAGAVHTRRSRLRQDGIAGIPSPTIGFTPRSSGDGVGERRAPSHRDEPVAVRVHSPGQPVDVYQRIGAKPVTSRGRDGDGGRAAGGRGDGLGCTAVQLDDRGSGEDERLRIGS